MPDSANIAPDSAKERAVRQAKGNPAANATRRAKRTIGHYRHYSVLASAAVMLLGTVIGLVFFARPGTSVVENRELTSFPAPSAQTFLDGQFFTNVSLWYADTYPLREPMVRAAQKAKSLYGRQPDEALYGGNRQSDELPTEEEIAQTQLEGGVARRNKDIAPPEGHTALENLEAQITDGIYVTDDACYTLYYFSQDAADEYCGVVNEAADKLDGIANVYSVLLPTNAGVMLDPQLQQDLGAVVQEQAIDYFYSRMSDKVIPVETFKPIAKHKDEYLYFRTDHHWTQLGAYYAYESFCAAKGIQPADYDSWEEVSFDGFLGAYYSAVGIADMANHADTVIARIPPGANDMVYWSNDLDPASAVDSHVINDVSDSDPTALYYAYLSGNMPLAKVVNPTIHDGSSCVIIKDSFGNPFTTLLVGSYETVYAFDFRFTSQDLVSFVKAHDIDDVIIENCIMFAGTYDGASLVGQIVDGGNAALAGGGPDVDDVAGSSVEDVNAEQGDA